MYKLGILGATGAVGQEMMKILEERKFPVSELRLIASERSAGKKYSFAGQEVEVVAASDAAFEGLDIVLGAATVILAMGEGRRAAAGINAYLNS